VGLDAQHLE